MRARSQRTCLGSRIVSTNVLLFTPRAELEPQQNLEAFIDVCRHSEVLNAKVQFDKNVWDIGFLKGHNKAHRAVFTTMEAAKASAYEPCMPAPFLDFAKAVLVYLHDSRPVVSQARRVAALRCLEASLQEWNKASRPTAVNVEILDTAVELARRSLSPGTAYGVAGQIQLVAELMQSKGFISLRQPWQHSMKKPAELGSRISKEALKARQEKMPSAAALRALGGIFQEAVEPRDIVVSSYAALMTCAPERVNEVLRLQRNCVVEGDGRFVGKLGLRWAGSKGAEDTVKWLPTEMVPVAKQAVANLLQASEDAHRLAAWYTAHPDTLYLHEGATHLRGLEVLATRQIALILWGDEGARDSVSVWAKAFQLQPELLAGHRRRVAYRFKDVETAVLSMLPKTFPYVPGAARLLCKDALAVTRINEMHVQKSTYLCMFTCVDYSVVANALTRHGEQPSIFTRFNYVEDDGSPIEMNTHSLRHYLNMLAQMGGMTSAEIALFSGRKDVSQNRAYDHMSIDEVQAPISNALKVGFMGNLVLTPARQLIQRSQFSQLGASAAHTTQYGSCMHDFASEPCQMHRDCVNCEEQECVKGDLHKEQNLRAIKAETEALLKAAKEALGEKEYGADSWVAHQTRTLERVNALLALLEDPSVPMGARIRLDIANAPLITQDDGVHPMHFIPTNRLKTLA